MHSFRNKVVVITGAVGNLGRASAEAFRVAGAHTVLVDRAGDRLHHRFADFVVSPDHLLLDTPQKRAANPNADHSRWVAPEAIADVILFLASGDSEHRTVHGAVRGGLCRVLHHV